MNDIKSANVSIIIRTYNEIKYIQKCLDSIFEQEFNGSVEVIIVDSGSTDGTLQVAKLNKCLVIELAKDDFTFGRSLNLGIQAASSDLIVSLSAHCVPFGNKWLQKLTSPITLNQAEMVYGRHISSVNSRTSEQNYFKEKFGEISFYTESPLLNNGNSAFAKKIWIDHKFNEILPAQEDLEFSLWYLENYKRRIFYSAESIVTHFHNDRNSRLYNRLYKELCVEYHFRLRVGIEILLIPFQTLKQILFDLGSAHRKGLLIRAFFGIICFRLIQMGANLIAFLTHKYMMRAYDR